MTKANLYPPVESNPSFPAIEREVLEIWKRDHVFEASVCNRPQLVDGKSNEFIFYDGPPFANGLPHYGHLVTGFVKDLIPRYQTMKGRHVERRFGWDCHGLPAELEVEKELGVAGRNAILDYGIANFNAKCRESVQRYTKEWEWYVSREARWASFENDYKTMDITFMESVMWAFKTLWDKGLVYEGYRVVPYSWTVQTPLSNFETRLDNSYRERLDPALTVGFVLEAMSGEPFETKLLAWTTTPWTLPSNMALCVNAVLDYAVFDGDGKERWILAAESVERYERELKGFTRVSTIKGTELIGRRYAPLFPYFKDTANAFRVISGAFVSTSDGTGVVHIAPGFGEDDFEVSRVEGIPLVVPVDAAGKFTSEISDYVGQNVILEANANIIKDLKARGGVVVRHDQYRHNYPHCWRTDQPLIYKAVESWYVKVSSFRDRMVDLNKKINWTPEHVKEGIFGNWLANARDWNVSRNRFWGTPIPVWKSDDPRYPRVDVYGSLDELERDFGVRPGDLHRPMIDDLVRPNPDDPTGKSTMRRVPDVLDCWFESGSMPFAQLHYPFENKERFEANFPGDFIVEYVAQTRGWFYTMMVLSTALFDRAPFKNCVCHGVVLDENYQKLSKRLKNYPDPVEVFDTHGADALRWYMLSSPLMAGGDLAMPRDGRDIGKAARQVIFRLWNAYSFFTLYANIDGIRAKPRADSSNVLDRYVLAKTRQMVTEVQDRLDHYDIPGAFAPLSGFIDALNNWYIRGRRSCFWSDDNLVDKQAAYDTLFTVLTTACRTLAPLMPFITDRIYMNLTGERSVHLASWPDHCVLPDDATLVSRMDLARDVCSAVLSLREVHRRRTRLPLRLLTVVHPWAESLRDYAPIIGEAINVKDVILTKDVERYGRREIKVNSKIGARLGSKMKDVIAAQRAADFVLRDDGHVDIAGMTLKPSDFELRIRTPEGQAGQTVDGWRGIVLLDVEIDASLQAEGWARDFVRLVQQARKNAEFGISDRIRLQIKADGAIAEAIRAHRSVIAAATLAATVDFVDEPRGEYSTSEFIDDQGLTFGIARTDNAAFVA